LPAAKGVATDCTDHTDGKGLTTLKNFASQ